MTRKNRGGLNMVKEIDCGGMPTAVNSLQLTSIFTNGRPRFSVSRTLLSFVTVLAYHVVCGLTATEFLVAAAPRRKNPNFFKDTETGFCYFKSERPLN